MIKILTRGASPPSGPLEITTGEGYSKKRTKTQKEEGALQRTYVRSCNFQMVITCEASQINKTDFQRLYTQDRILIDITQTFDKF